MTRIERILLIAFGIYVALLPWQTRVLVSQPQLGSQFIEYGSLSIYATDALLALIVFGAAFVGYRSRGSAKVWSAALVLVGISFASAIFADRSDVALQSFRLILIGVAVLWVSQQPWVSCSFILTCFVAGAVLQAVFGIGQFLAQTSPAFSWLGLASHDPSVSGTSVVEAGGMRWLRAYGSLPHPNILGGYLAAALLMAFGLYLRQYDIVREGFAKWTRENIHRHLEGKRWYWQQSWRIAGLLVVCAVLTTGLLLTFSRSAWLGFGIAWVILLIALLVLRWPWGTWLWVKWTFFVGVIATFVILAAPSAFLARSTATGRLEDLSLTTRSQQYRDAYVLLKANPIRGVGLGNMVVATYDQVSRLRASADDYQPVHNIYLLSMVELGVVGGITFFAFVLFAYWETLTQLLKRTTWVTLTLLAGLTCLLVIGLLDHYLWDLGVGVGVLWLVIGLGSRTEK